MTTYVSRHRLPRIALALLVLVLVVLAASWGYGRFEQSNRWAGVRSYAEDLAARADASVYEELGPCESSDGDASVELHLQGSSPRDLDQRVAALEDLLVQDGWQNDTRRIGNAQATVLVGDKTSSSSLGRVWISTPAAEHCLLGIA